MQIERLEEMRLTPKDEAQIATLLHDAFRADYQGRSYYQQRHHVRFVMRDADRLVGHVAVSMRAIRVDTNIVQVAGLAEVATAPDACGQGIATSLVNAAIADARSSLAEFLILFGDEPLYAKAGFQPYTNTIRYSDFVHVATGQVQDRIKEGLMVKPLKDRTWDKDADIDLVGHAF